MDNIFTLKVVTKFGTTKLIHHITPNTLKFAIKEVLSEPTDVGIILGIRGGYTNNPNDFFYTVNKNGQSTTDKSTI